MATFHVVAKDKATEKHTVLSVTGSHTAESAMEHVKKSPGAIGGTHDGFEPVEALTDHKEAAKKAGELDAAAAVPVVTT